MSWALSVAEAFAHVAPIEVLQATEPAAAGGKEAAPANGGRRAASGRAGRAANGAPPPGRRGAAMLPAGPLMLFLLQARGFKLLYVDKTLLWRNKAFSQRDIALYDGVLLKVGDTILW